MAKYMGDALDMFSRVATVAKQVALNLSEIEIKVDEATNNEPWGPHGAAMTGESVLFPSPLVCSFGISATFNSI